MDSCLPHLCQGQSNSCVVLSCLFKEQKREIERHAYPFFLPYMHCPGQDPE